MQFTEVWGTLSKEETVVRHTNQVPGSTVGPTPVSVEKRQLETLNQIAREGQGKTGPPKLLSLLNRAQNIAMIAFRQRRMKLRWAS
jgi:hypothetical protein